MNKGKEATGPLDETTQILRTEELEAKLRAGQKIPALIVIDGNDTGQIFKLTAAAMSLGRGSTASIRVNDKTVSRKHCLLETTPAYVTVIDLQSANGTSVNGDRIQKRRLVNGDKIRVGSTVLKFELADADESEFHEKLYHLITFDDLTSLYNRKYLMNHLEFLFRGRQPTQPVTLLFLDLDHFKLVNDTYDHLTGSEVLSELGRLLLSNLRATDIACRYGGEEFIIILPGASLAIASERARTLLEEVKTVRAEFGGIELGPISLSLGVAVFPDHGATGGEVVQAADKALLAAKREGRARVVVAS